jgi:hypothetical protein
MLELGPVNKISDKARIFGDFDANCIFDCPHRGQSMGVGSDPAGALNKMMGVTGIAAL